MTEVSASMRQGEATRTSLQRLILLAVLGVLASVLAGCASGSLSSVFSGSGSRSAKMAPVTFAPIIGAPSEVSQKLSGELITAAQAKKLNVVTTPGAQADYTVRGYLAASQEKQSSKVAYIWDVTDKSGKRVHRILGEETVPGRPGGDPWATIDQNAIQKIAAKTAADLASWLPKQSASGETAAPTALSTSSQEPQRQAALPEQPGETMVFVPAVSGAPGDGRKSLTVAVKKELFKRGLKMTGTTSGSNIYTVRGEVKMGKSSGGQQDINIEWQVVHPNGKRLGTVSQANKIPEGSLDNEWGPVADAAAAAAADGIAKLIPKP